MNSTEIQTDSTTMSVSINRYASGEVSEVSIDLIVGVGAVLVGFASLIGLIFMFGWMKKKVPKF